MCPDFPAKPIKPAHSEILFLPHLIFFFIKAKPINIIHKFLHIFFLSHFLTPSSYSSSWFKLLFWFYRAFQILQNITFSHFSFKSLYYLDLFYIVFCFYVLIFLLADLPCSVLRNDLFNSPTMTHLFIWILSPLSEVILLIFYVNEFQITSCSRLELYLIIYEASWKALAQHKMFN